MDKRASIFISVVMPSVVKEQSQRIVLVVTCMVLDSIDDVCVVSACVRLSRGVGVYPVVCFPSKFSSSRYVYL